MRIVIGQGRVESMRGYQEVKFGRRWKTKVVAEVLKKMSGERVVKELTSSGGWAGQYATG